MWSELENYVKVPHCMYGKCKCGVGDNRKDDLGEEDPSIFDGA